MCGRIGSGLMPGNSGLSFATNFEVVDAGLGKNALEHAAAGAVHESMANLNPALFDFGEIDKLFERLDIGRLEIGADDFATRSLDLRSIEGRLDGS